MITRDSVGHRPVVTDNVSAVNRMTLRAWICRTCGNQYALSEEPPSQCVICEDPRQYVGWSGQEWVTLDQLQQDHRSELREVEPGLWGVGAAPSFGIGQRGLIVTTPGGNVLFDVPGFVDEAAFEKVDELGGLAAISASHPHFYGVAVEWSDRFDAPILLPAEDRDWVARPDPAYEFYDDEVAPVPGVHLVRCGGHFDGSAILHWHAGAEGKGVLLTGDTITVVPDRDAVSIMWSYPNLIPLDETTVRGVVARIEHLAYDRIYGGWWGRVVSGDAKRKVATSIDRYVSRIAGESN